MLVFLSSNFACIAAIRFNILNAGRPSGSWVVACLLVGAI